MAPVSRVQRRRVRVLAQPWPGKGSISLPDGQIVYVDRLGPRILAVPPDPAVRLSRQTLRELNKGNLTGRLAQGARFLSKWMTQCPEITIHTNGQYTVQKKKNDPNGARSHVPLQSKRSTSGRENQENHTKIEILRTSSFIPWVQTNYQAIIPGRTIDWNEEKALWNWRRQQETAWPNKKFAESPKPIADVIDEYKEET